MNGNRPLFRLTGIICALVMGSSPCFAQTSAAMPTAATAGTITAKHDLVDWVLNPFWIGR
ncbi:MAG TPA: hypothetical protein VMW38_09755 [Terriglobia bacterium]|nr:hypothetical protein [Terriglobia bacterium]